MLDNVIMKKNNKITALIVALFIVIVIIISAIFIYKKLTYREIIVSIDDVIEVNNNVQENLCIRRGNESSIAAYTQFGCQKKYENDVVY